MLVWLRRPRAWLGIGVVLAVLAGASIALWPEREGDDAAPTLVRPNIVLVLTDDQSLESVSRMPFVSGRQDWVRFDNAFLNVALCCPSRASILTGQYSHHTGVESNVDGAAFRDGSTVATWLDGAGYRTGYIGKYLNNYPWGRGNVVPPGWDDWHAFVGGAAYFNYQINDNGTMTRKGSRPVDYSTDVLANKAQKFIARGRSPFFLVVAPNAPHGPRTPAPRHRGAFAGDDLPVPASFNEADVSDKPRWVQELAPRDAEEMDVLRRRQYRTLLAVDDLVRRVFSALEQQGVLDDTVVAFMSDNGYSFGEHRYEKKVCPYEECVRTPLLVRYPGQPGRRVSALAQNVDLAPTFADLAGVQPGGPVDGRSLVPLLRGQSEPWRTGVLLRWAGPVPGAPADPETGEAIPAFWAIRTARYKYVELATGETELYDLRSDPHELTNRARDPSTRQLVADLRDQLATLRNGSEAS